MQLSSLCGLGRVPPEQGSHRLPKYFLRMKSCVMLPGVSARGLPGPFPAPRAVQPGGLGNAHRCSEIQKGSDLHGNGKSNH